jgi:acyl carrier protein
VRERTAVEATNGATVQGVAAVLAETLGIEDRKNSLDASTPLFGSLPELDSLGVVEVTLALEKRFDITIEDEDVTAEVFRTVGSVAALVDAKLR